MNLYRKIIPKIARDALRALYAKKWIEIEDGKQDEAELDLAAIMVEYLNTEEQITKEAKELMARRGLAADRLAQAKKSVAEARKVKVGEEGLDYVLEQLVEGLFASKNIAEVFAEDHELRKCIHEVITKYASISEDIDKEARSRIRNLREGSPEWDIEYPRIIAQIKRQKGLS